MRKTEGVVLFDVKESIGYVTINRPEAMNAINTDVLDALDEIFDYIAKADEVGGVIVTGAGKAFVAGADIAQMRNLPVMGGRDMCVKGQKVMDKIEATEKPVIAAVNGYALGGGCELSMACDMRFASEKAKFGQPEVNLGIIPGFGGTQRLPRLVGTGMAKHLIYSAEIIGAEDALRIGLVEKVFAPEELLAECEKYVKQLMTKGPIALRMAKTAINRGMNMDVQSGVAFEAEAYVTSFCTEDRIEGMSAFVEKRSAEFKNK